MKDIRQCSISSIAFTLEIDAYEALYNYLESIRARYTDNPDGEEILSDIEARIAELILSVHGAERVVAKPLVDNIIGQMGSANDICDSEPTTQDEEPPKEQNKARRHLYRNIDDAPIGGVCSGIAAYAGCSAATVRIITLLLLIFGGVSFWIYIILWLVIPAAETARQKLEMRGEPITVSTIRDYYDSIAESPATRSLIERIVSAIGRVIMFFLKFLVVCILIGLILALMAMVVGCGTLILSGGISEGWLSIAVPLFALCSLAMLLGLGIYAALQIIYSRRVSPAVILGGLLLWFILSISAAGVVAYHSDEFDTDNIINHFEINYSSNEN